MLARRAPSRRSPGARRAAALAAASVLALGVRALTADDAAPPAPQPAAPSPAAPAAPAPGPTPAVPVSFPTAEAAAQALFDALAKNDDAALRGLVGPGNEDLVQDASDPVSAPQRAALSAAAKAHLTLDRRADGRVVMVVGAMEYPLAVPLVERDGRWRLDAVAGREELLARRIGEHELEAIGVCLAYVDAQLQYASKDRDGDGVKEYAQRLGSTPGKRDGLYWESAPGEESSPAGPDLTPFREATNPDANCKAPFDGYYWRILTGQGANAPGGAYSYVINGRMIAGFALIAVPAVYRNSGVMSFITSNQGKVYEKDLGPDTLRVAAAIGAFDPDPSWKEVEEATIKAAAQTSPEDAPFVPKGEGATKPPSASESGALPPAAPAMPSPQR